MILFQTDELQIATVSDRDVPALLQVYKQCEDFLSLGPVPRASIQMLQGDIEHSRGENGRYCAIRTHSDLTVGVIDFIPNSDDRNTSFLSLLMIAAPWRNKGYGQAVVASLEQHLRRTHHTEQIDCAVQTNNSAAIRFWTRLGYALSKEPCRQSDGTITYRMSKTLRGTC